MKHLRPSSFDRWKLFGSLVLYIDQRRSPHLTLRCFPQSKLMTVSMQRARVRAEWVELMRSPPRSRAAGYRAAISCCGPLRPWPMRRHVRSWPKQTPHPQLDIDARCPSKPLPGRDRAPVVKCSGRRQFPCWGVQMRPSREWTLGAPRSLVPASGDSVQGPRRVFHDRWRPPNRLAGRDRAPVIGLRSSAFVQAARLFQRPFQPFP